MTQKTRSIFFVQGGAGDVLAHTPMIRYFRKKYPDDEILVITTYAQLWEGNPNVDKVIPAKELEDFYSEYVLGHNVRFFKKHFVYDAIMDDAAIGTKCLPEFICKLYGAEYDWKPLDYFVAAKEKKTADVFMGQYKQFNKPLVLLQCTGAIPSDGNFNKTNKLKDLDVKKVAELVKRHSDKAIFLQIGLIGEPLVEGAVDALGQPMREAIACLEHAASFIFIESLFAHCSNALNKTGIVVFQNTSPSFFGYANNHNISFSGGCELWPCNRPVGALVDVLPGYRNPKTREKLLWECPDQKCSRMPIEQLETVFLETIGVKPATTQPIDIGRVSPQATIVKGDEALNTARDKFTVEEVRQAMEKRRGVVPPPVNAQTNANPAWEETPFEQEMSGPNIPMEPWKPAVDNLHQAKLANPGYEGVDLDAERKSRAEELKTLEMLKSGWHADEQKVNQAESLMDFPFKPNA
jgi:ADP-heptose:LPS heptosyltransferase